jgi:signal transduction histidine kinase
MNSSDLKNQSPISKPPLQTFWKPLAILTVALLLTAVSVYYTKTYIEKTAIQDFEFAAIDLQSKMYTRLRAHAQLLRSGAALFAASDTVTREMWHNFYENTRISRYLPGIQGYGYSHIIPRDQLQRHIQSLRDSGFSDYNVFPEGDRELYTSIIYLEPFSGRNLRAFGYDMFSEPVRREAMETSRDSSFAVLSGKVRLVQETEEDVQAGALMYIPVYRQGMPVNTVEERRAAIKGWVYSPYRINDLTGGILGNWDLPGKNRIHLRIYDGGEVSDEALLYDSQRDERENNNDTPNLSIALPVQLNSEEWLMVFTRKSEDLSLLNGDLLVVLISGIIISILMFLLSLALIRTNIHALQIEKLNMQLEKLNHDKDRFISILGHDLRNPFNSILGFLDILTKDFHTLDKDKIENFVNYINNTTKNTYNMLEDLLEWAKVQSGNLPFEPKLSGLRDICMRILKNLYPGAIAKNITIKCNTGEDLMVYADVEMLKTIIRNLVSNAIKFTRDGGLITINAVEDDGQVIISVSDNGVGIKPEDIPKLFAISNTFTTKGTADETGSGLGLILCKEMADAHGGKIWVESEPGSGSTFLFSLPLKQSIATSRNSLVKSN